MNRRTLIRRGLGLTLLPLLNFFNTKTSKANEVQLSTLAQEIEKVLITSCNKLDKFGKKLDPYLLEGVYTDPTLYRQRRVGCYWYWEYPDGNEYAGALDYKIKELKEKYSLDKVNQAWENAINEIHNKYTNSNRTEYSNYGKYLDS